MRLSYPIGSIISLPLLPIMYYQGKRIRQRIPKLPEAQEPSGIVRVNSKEQLRLLCIGESTVAGVGVKTHEEGFTGTLAKALGRKWELDMEWDVIAKSGFTAASVNDKLVPKIKKEYDVIVVGLGGNDAFTLNAPKNWKKDISRLIASLKSKAPKAQIFFTNMPPIRIFPAFTPLIRFVVGGLVELLGEELERVSQEHEQVYYNPETITIEEWLLRYPQVSEKEEFFSDGVHPSKLTYQIWAEDFATFINSKLPK